MEAKCTRLEKELEERSVDKLDNGEEEDNATSHQVGLEVNNQHCHNDSPPAALVWEQQWFGDRERDGGGGQSFREVSARWAAWIMDFYKKQRNSLYCTYNVKIASPSILYFITQILSL